MGYVENLLIALYHYCDLLNLESDFCHCQMIWRSALPDHQPDQMGHLENGFQGQIAIYLFMACDIGLGLHNHPPHTIRVAIAVAFWYISQ